MDESTGNLQKLAILLAIFMGLGFLVLIGYFVKKDRRSTSEKMVDKARDLASNIPVGSR